MVLTHTDLLERQLQDLSKDLERLRLDMKFLREDTSHGRLVDTRLKGDIEVLEVRLKTLEGRKEPLKL